MLFSTSIRRRFRRCVKWLTWVLFFAHLPLASAASSSTKLDEYKIKAVFLFNFTQLVSWPEDAFATDDSPLTVCVLGDNPFDGKLAKILHGESREGRPLTLKQLDTITPIDHCHILFVGESARQHFVAIRDQLSGAAVLTVGDYDEFIADGGMIELAHKKKRMYFKVNLTRTKRHSVFPSSKLLRLAVIVDDSEGEGR